MSGDGQPTDPAMPPARHRWGRRLLAVVVTTVLLGGLGIGTALSAPTFARSVGLPVALVGGEA
ncbi:MAG TPA: hypothetical protein VNP37_10010, partial [Actinomycetospora sp.]|nr:hypothetical protein [Actinomycetospora sp.]